MTESRASGAKPTREAVEKPSSTPAGTPEPARATRRPRAAATAQAAKAPTEAKAIAAGPSVAVRPAGRHPNLGLSPVDMKAGHPAAAEKLRGVAARVSASALEAAVKADPALSGRYDEVGLRRLLRDGELLVERLAMCLASGNDRWLIEYAEWIGPIYRRRGVPLGDLSALCAAIGETIGPLLGPDELAAATGSLQAATAVFKRNGRLAGDRHKRNALWKWMYRGV